MSLLTFEFGDVALEAATLPAANGLRAATGAITASRSRGGGHGYRLQSGQQLALNRTDPITPSVGHNTAQWDAVFALYIEALPTTPTEFIGCYGLSDGTGVGLWSQMAYYEPSDTYQYVDSNSVLHTATGPALMPRYGSFASTVVAAGTELRFCRWLLNPDGSLTLQDSYDGAGSGNVQWESDGAPLFTAGQWYIVQVAAGSPIDPVKSDTNPAGSTPGTARISVWELDASGWTIPSLPAYGPGESITVTVHDSTGPGTHSTAWAASLRDDLAAHWLTIRGAGTVVVDDVGWIADGTFDSIDGAASIQWTAPGGEVTRYPLQQKWRVLPAASTIAQGGWSAGLDEVDDLPPSGGSATSSGAAPDALRLQWGPFRPTIPDTEAVTDLFVVLAHQAGASVPQGSVTYLRGGFASPPPQQHGFTFGHGASGVRAYERWSVRDMVGGDGDPLSSQQQLYTARDHGPEIDVARTTAGDAVLELAAVLVGTLPLTGALVDAFPQSIANPTSMGPYLGLYQPSLSIGVQRTGLIPLDGLLPSREGFDPRGLGQAYLQAGADGYRLVGQLCVPLLYDRLPLANVANYPIADTPDYAGAPSIRCGIDVPDWAPPVLLGVVADHAQVKIITAVLQVAPVSPDYYPVLGTNRFLRFNDIVLPYGPSNPPPPPPPTGGGAPLGNVEVGVGGGGIVPS